MVAGTPQVVKRSAVTPPHDGPSRRGVYVLGMGSVLFAGTHPAQFGDLVDRPNFGAAYGLRVGFQVNNIAGFEATFEHSSIFTYSSAWARSSATSAAPNYYRIIGDRVVPGLRVLSTGKTVRFVGNFGGGFVSDQIVFVQPTCSMNGSKTGTQCVLQRQPRGG